MRNKSLIQLALVSLIFFSSCTKQPEHVNKSNEKDLLTFKIEAALNKNLIKEDIPGVISQDTIILTVLKSVKLSNLIATFSSSGQSVFIGSVEQKTGVTANDFSKKVSYKVKAEDGTEKEYALLVKEKVPDWKSGVPHIFLDTENGAPIVSKEDYLKADLKIEGVGDFENYTGKTQIKGRGNSTWELKKKPYRLKLDKAASLLGLSEEKDWILLANAQDYTLMLNAIAMKTGQLLEMPYTNNIIPVDLTINGKYLGNYTFTEQKEVAPNRIDLKEGGVLLEMDIYFDEKYKFRSDFYNLPVMVAYPELEDYHEAEAATALAKIKSDFNVMEKAVSAASFPANYYLDYIDASAMVDYLIVYNLCQNEEINHPKSTYMHKHKDGKYKMGIIWDFDWAFDFEDDNIYFNSYNNPLFWNSAKANVGTKFFSPFLKDPVIKSLYKKEWTAFKANKFPQLLKYLDEYAILIAESQKRNYAIHLGGSGDFKSDVQKLKNFLQKRAAYIDNYVASF